MSGGVDSSVAAALLSEAGHEVVGVTLHLYDSGPGRRVGRCCAAVDQDDARRAAAHLGIRHYTLDWRERFDRLVIRDFVQTYAAGETPTPCTRCNVDVKFGPLVDVCRGLGTEWLATGHYARVEVDENGTRKLLRGRDDLKDQSYFLFALPQEVLKRTVFPLGWLTKTQVREQARRLGLPNAEKPESMEVCFVEGASVGDFVARRLPAPPAPGIVVDGQGQRIGGHPGIHHYTVGQRRGLPVLGDGKPRYVVALDGASGTVIAGRPEELDRLELDTRDVSWVGGTPPASARPLAVQVRHRHVPAEALVVPDGSDRARVRFTSPIRAVANGQAAVFYSGDEVVGGGWIAASR
ncbi:MAG: tRNA 2-thiouridine(34) synthase MnmA [Deltaproteobacteria bacterium]|nr:tRNA 2-thiouridine(34) synthase MnmA [Deltaproteobacteria bacterium]